MQKEFYHMTVSLIYLFHRFLWARMILFIDDMGCSVMTVLGYSIHPSQVLAGHSALFKRSFGCRADLFFIHRQVLLLLTMGSRYCDPYMARANSLLKHPWLLLRFLSVIAPFLDARIEVFFVFRVVD